MAEKQQHLLAMARFQRLVAASRCARALADGNTEAWALEYETGTAPWDDFSERRSADGLVCVVHVQVKGNATHLELALISEMLGALYTADPNTEFELVLRAHLSITDTPWSTHHLAGMYAKSVSGRKLSKLESGLLKKLHETSGRSDLAETRKAVTRLRVVRVGEEDDVVGRGKGAIREHYFPEAVDRVWSRIYELVDGLVEPGLPATLTGTHLLGDLAPFGAMVRPSPPTMAQLRARYLTAVIEAQASRRSLGELVPDAPLLRDVYQRIRGRRTTSGPIVDALGSTVDAALARASVSIVGGVGSGKSELLHCVAADLARRAISNVDAPLPVLVTAQDVRRRDGETLARLARSSAGAQAVERLLMTQARWVVLVDGLDEAPLDALTWARAQLGEGKLAAVVTTSRFPSTDRDGRVSITLEPWTGEDVSKLWGRWVDASGSAGARPSWDPSLARMLDSPLVAAFAVEVSGRASGPPQTRAELLASIVEMMFSRWASLRAPAQPAQWEELAEAMRAAAFDALATGRGAIPGSELRAILRRTNRGTSEKVLAAAGAAQLGVLIEREGRFEFPIRLIAEHLAGEELAERGADEITRVSREPWGREVARCAIGCLELEKRSAEIDATIAALVRSTDETGKAPELRGLVTAAMAAGDLKAVSAEPAAGLLVAVEEKLCEEQSRWEGDLFVECARHLLRSRIGGADAFAERLADRNALTEAPEAWFRRQLWTDPAQWVEVLLHRDAGARVAAIEKLRQWASLPFVRNALLLELHDVALDRTFARAPAVEAGLALRYLDRAELDQVVTEMRGRVREAQAMDAIPAVAFLRPGEAPATELAATLKNHFAFSRLPIEIVQELAATDEGAAALGDVWPDWMKVPVFASPQVFKPTVGPNDAQPPSMTVRLRIEQALAGSARRGASHVWEHIAWAARAEQVELLVEAGDKQPEAVAAFLRERLQREEPVSPGAEEALRTLITRLPTLTEVMVSGWRPDVAHAASVYPGRVLEPLIEDAADERAMAIYAEWLPGSRNLMGGHSAYGRLSERALLSPTIRAIAFGQAQRLLKNAVEGWTEPDGRLVRPWPPATGAALGELAAAWRETELRDAVIAWGMSSNGRLAEYLLGLLDAFEVVSFTSEERRNVGAVIAPHLRWPKDATFVHARAPGLVQALTAAGLAAEVRVELELLVDGGHPVCVHAAVALGTLEPTRLPHWSAQASQVALHIQLGEMAPNNLRTLVRSSPEAWAAWLARSIASEPITTRGAVDVLRSLPSTLRADAARNWLARAGHLELPWFHEDWHAPGFRLADLIRGLLFDAEAADQLAVE